MYARESMHDKTCKFCHTTFGEHSEEQFDACWNRLLEERQRLMAEGKIPGPKLTSYVMPAEDPKESYRKIRALIGLHMCPLCNRNMNDQSDEELQKCVDKMADKKMTRISEFSPIERLFRINDCRGNCLGW
jgi:hypothetical protein